MSLARDPRWLDSSLVLAVGVVCYTAVFIVVTRCVTTLKTAVWQTTIGADLIKKCSLNMK